MTCCASARLHVIERASGPDGLAIRVGAPTDCEIEGVSLELASGRLSTTATVSPPPPQAATNTTMSATSRRRCTRASWISERATSVLRSEQNNRSTLFGKKLQAMCFRIRVVRRDCESTGVNRNLPRQDGQVLEALTRPLRSYVSLGTVREEQAG